MESTLACNHKWQSDLQNQTTAKWEFDLSITSMITDRIGCYQLIIIFTISEKKLINLGQTSSVILEISLFFLDKLLLSWLLWLILWMVDLADLWLAASTVRLQASNCSKLSDYTVQLWLYRMISGKLSSKCTNHIEKIVMVMNNQLIPFWTPSIVSDKAKNDFCFSKEKLVHKNTLIKFKKMF